MRNARVTRGQERSLFFHSLSCAHLTFFSREMCGHIADRLLFSCAKFPSESSLVNRVYFLSIFKVLDIFDLV